VNPQSAVPVHVQLTAQIRHLIATGQLKPGVQLPTVRQLAGFLRINRNTVVRAFAQLHRDGFLEGRAGRGTFVVQHPPARQGRAARSLDRLVAETLERARRLGFSHEEFLATVAARAPQGRTPRAGRDRIVLVECNWEELARYQAELEAELPVSVEPVLAEELPGRLAREPGFLQGSRAVVTTFFHVHEVRRAVAGGLPVVALLSEANILTLQRLTELPEGTPVGLVCATPTGSQNLLRSVQSAGLGHLDPILASLEDGWSIEHMLERTRTVVCSEQAAARVAGRLPADAEIIVFDRTLDRGGLDMLRDLLASLPGAGVPA
jgi:DNA-binding transcriptional regulator YhcF (GntR family)